MFALYKIAGAFAAPPGLFVIILLAMAAALFLKSRRTRFAFGTAASLAIFVFAAALCVMSTPAGARFITGPLEAKYAAQLPPDGETADFLLLPGGSLYDPGGSSVPTPPLAPGGPPRTRGRLVVRRGRPVGPARPARARARLHRSDARLRARRKVRARHVRRQRLRRQGPLRSLRHARRRACYGLARRDNFRRAVAHHRRKHEIQRRPAPRPRPANRRSRHKRLPPSASHAPRPAIHAGGTTLLRRPAAPDRPDNPRPSVLPARRGKPAPLVHRHERAHRHSNSGYLKSIAA